MLSAFFCVCCPIYTIAQDQTQNPPQNQTLAESVQTVPVLLWADSSNRGYEPSLSMDGNPDTMWHTQFNTPASGKSNAIIQLSCGYEYGCNREHGYFNALTAEKQAQNTAETPNADQKSDDPSAALTISTVSNAPLPHSLLIDLGKTFELRGFTYLPRKGGENGTIGQYEFYVGDCPHDFGKPAVSGVFTQKDGLNKVLFDVPVSGRYVKLTAISEVNHQPFTSVAELELLSEGYRFIAAENKVNANSVSRQISSEIAQKAFEKAFGSSVETLPNQTKNVFFQESVDQYNILLKEFGREDYYDYVKDQVLNEQTLILSEDRDPVDVVFRRTLALFESLKNQLDETDPLADGKTLAIYQDWFAQTETAKNSVSPDQPEERFALFLQICNVRRALMFSNPELNFSEILFVKKHRSSYNHICDQFYGRSAVPGGEISVLSGFLTFPFAGQKEPETRNLLADSTVQNDSRLKGQKLEGGSFVSPDLSFEGDRIAFAYVECQGSADHIDHLDLSRGHTQEGRCYHIFTCNRDGSDLRMITDGTWNDFDPCYLPNTRMAFISERRGGYLRCGRDCPTYTLFDMNEDGTQKRCLSYHETNEWGPSVTNDGKILWTRWDYIDRFGCIAHHPWTTSLDGRDPRSVHGNFSPRHLRADSEVDLRSIPNSPKYIGTGGPHHGQNYGSLVLIDPQIEDDDAMEPVKRLTPDVCFPESQAGGQVWGTPWPLTETLYLAVADYSMQPNQGTESGPVVRGDYGIYLLDEFGNRELIYRDPEIGCASPIPFVPREKPTVNATLIPNEEIVDQPYVIPPKDFNAPRPEAVVIISNIYDSTKPWPTGTKIKSLRVVEVYCMSVPSGYHPHETGYREASSGDSVNLARGSWGTVPVEDDGSANFTVPANCEIYFQALDENGLAVQSMRSGTSLKEGESLSCVGCHEPKHQTPTATTSLPKAFLRAPSKLKPEAEGANPMSYPILVQPVLEKYCVDCHDSADSKEAGAPNLHKEPSARKFYASYNSLVGGGFAFYDYGDPLITKPGEFGARASKLYRMFQEGHYDVEKKMSKEDMSKIMLWMDLLSNFYGVYEKENGIKQFNGETVYPTLE